MIVKLHGVRAQNAFFSANQIYYTRTEYLRRNARMSKRLLGVIIASLVLLSMVVVPVGAQKKFTIGGGRLD